jgi:hypothetical protein
MQGGIPLKLSDREEYIRYLKRINNTKRSIAEGMIRSIELAASSREVSDIITSSLTNLIKNSSIE